MDWFLIFIIAYALVIYVLLAEGIRREFRKWL